MGIVPNYFFLNKIQLWFIRWMANIYNKIMFETHQPIDVYKSKQPFSVLINGERKRERERLRQRETVIWIEHFEKVDDVILSCYRRIASLVLYIVCYRKSRLEENKQLFKVLKKVGPPLTLE